MRREVITAVVVSLTLAASASPQLLFRAGFDGTAVAETAGGSAEPVDARARYAFVPGRRGQALVVRPGEGTPPIYRAAGNLVSERGAVTFWYRPERASLNDGGTGWRFFFRTLPLNRGMSRHGSGDLIFWRYDHSLRADVSDDADSYVSGGSPLTDGWNHLVFNWTEKGAEIWLNGQPVGGRLIDASALFAARRKSFPLKPGTGSLDFANRKRPEMFVLGGPSRMDGAIDDFEIWSEPLSTAQIAVKAASDDSMPACKHGGTRKASGAEESTANLSASNHVGRASSPCIMDDASSLLPGRGRPGHGQDGLKSASLGPEVAKCFAKDHPNPHLGASFGAGGEIPNLELVEQMRFDSVPSDTNRFVSFGALRVGELNGVRYLEAGRRACDRWAYRFLLPQDGAPLYVIDVDYPDDVKRTMDVLVQGSRERRWDGTPGADYVLQAGIVCGDEYVHSGRILTDRYVYWRRGDDITLSTMTCRGEAPAAIAAVRIYRVKDGRLPVADVREPPANDDGWRRTFALYYEDVSMGYNFAVPGDGGDAASIGPLLDRLIAIMKFTGQNVLCYPGCWYGGLIGESYSPRRHVLGYRQSIYGKFDRAGLGYLPTINQFQLRLPSPEMRAAPGADGTCHASPLAIMADGKIAERAVHGRPAAYNILHPATQSNILASVDTLIAEGRDHPSFRGIVLHLARNSILWFGNDQSGYNDYCVERFGESVRSEALAKPRPSGEARTPPPRRCGVSPHRDGGFASSTSVRSVRGLEGLEKVDRKDPLRGKRYYEAICADPALYEKWIDWRCEQVAALYREIARRLAAARSDLKLVVCSFLVPDWHHPDFIRPGFLEACNRRAGLDARKLADLPNVIISQTEIPADCRWLGPRDPTNPKDHGNWGNAFAVAQPVYREMYARAGDFGSVLGATFPWIHQHDRYWEDHCAATESFNCHGLYPRGGRHHPLSNGWYVECPWRVSTLNPSGRDALKAYAVPLRFTDVLAMSKGGFLIGTYGTEDVLVPWMRAFRSLPAVKMTEFYRNGQVVARKATFRGKTYGYVINTGAEPACVRLEDLKATNTVTGQPLPAELRLPPYELVAFEQR